MERRSYPSDLTDDEWGLIEGLIPAPSGVGRPRSVNPREIVNAILYLADNGIKWRAMPHDLPPWSTVYDYYSRWVRTGVWKRMNDYLVRLVRRSEGRDEEPRLTVIDSRSVRTAEKRGKSKAMMAIKK